MFKYLLATREEINDVTSLLLPEQQFYNKHLGTESIYLANICITTQSPEKVDWDHVVNVGKTPESLSHLVERLREAKKLRDDCNV